jgi:hypothetical protein
MKIKRNRSKITTVLVGVLALVPLMMCIADALPSWSDGTSKNAIIAFVKKVTLKGSSEIIPPAERIATFENDATMLRRSEANNARLLKVHPKGFALDETHRPHITLIQRYVRTADLKQVYAAFGKVLAESFEPFVFSPAGAAVYQLGQFGTAAKKLKKWELNP